MKREKERTNQNIKQDTNTEVKDHDEEGKDWQRRK